MDRAERWPERPDDFFIKPKAIADEIWHVAHQDRSAWSFNVELRPLGNPGNATQRRNAKAKKLDRSSFIFSKAQGEFVLLRKIAGSVAVFMALAAVRAGAETVGVSTVGNQDWSDVPVQRTGVSAQQYRQGPHCLCKLRQ